MTIIRKNYIAEFLLNARQSGIISGLEKISTNSHLGSDLKKVGSEAVSEGAIPGKRKIFGVVKAAAKDFVKAPRKFIAEGIERDKAVRGAVGAAVGKDLSRKKLLQQGVTNLANSDDLKANTVGFIGSKVGAATGIPGAGLALDYLGARAGRRAIADTSAVKTALTKVRAAPEYAAAKTGTKLRMLGSEARSVARSNRAAAIASGAHERDLVGDRGGWAVGNAVGSVSPVPLGGAAAASLATGGIFRGYKRVRAGEKLHTVVGSELKHAATAPIRREAAVRSNVNNKFRQFLGVSS